MVVWFLCSVSRRQNGESKPLTVPKDIDLHLEKAPVNAIDALGKNKRSCIYTTVTLCRSKHYSSSAVDSPQLTPASKQLLTTTNVFLPLVSTFSVAFFPGVPVAGRFCRLCNGCLPVHWVLLQCCGRQKRSQYRSHLVCPDCSLRPVSLSC